MSIKLNLKKLENCSKSFKVSKDVNYDYLRFKSIFANEIFQYRKKNVLLQESLGEILEISQEMVSKYESANEDISIKKFCDIKNKLELRIELELDCKEDYVTQKSFSEKMRKKKDVSINLSRLKNLSKSFVVHEDVDVYYKKLLSRIGSKIYKFRKQNKYSQKELGQLINVSQVMISKYESGNYNFSIKKLYELSQLMNFNVRIRKPLLYEKTYSPIKMKDIVAIPRMQYDEIKVLKNIINKLIGKSKNNQFLENSIELKTRIKDKNNNFEYCINEKETSGYLACAPSNKGGNKYELC